MNNENRTLAKVFGILHAIFGIENCQTKFKCFHHRPIFNKRGVLFTIAAILLITPLFLASRNLMKQSQTSYLNTGTKMKYIESDIGLDFKEMLGFSAQYNGTTLNFTSVALNQGANINSLLSQYNTFIENVYREKFNTEITANITTGFSSELCGMQHEFRQNQIFINFGSCALQELHFALNVDKNFDEVIDTDTPSSDGSAHPKTHVDITSEDNRQVMHSQHFQNMYENNDDFYAKFGYWKFTDRHWDLIEDSNVSVSVGRNSGIDNSVDIRWSNVTATFNELYFTFKNQTNQSYTLKTDGTVSIKSNVGGVNKKGNLVIQE